MSNKKIILTDEGLKNLEDELEHLKTIKRKEVAEKIKVALSFGDLSENSEYDEAKNEQAILEARIAYLETTLKNVTVLDEDELTTEYISLGCKIVIKHHGLDQIFSYQIVGSTETNPSEGKISDESPVGKSLLGHKIGDIVDVETPGGVVSMEVMEISK